MAEVYSQRTPAREVPKTAPPARGTPPPKGKTPRSRSDVEAPGRSGEPSRSVPNGIQGAARIGARQTVVENPVTGKRRDTIADQLWKLPQNCKPKSIPILEKCLQDFQQVMQINKSSGAEQAEYDSKLQELMSKLESEKMKIIEAKGAKRNVVQQNYEAKSKQLAEARNKQLSELKGRVYKRYEEMVEEHDKTYVPAIARATKAVEFINKIINAFEIDKKKIPVQLDKKSVDVMQDVGIVAQYAKDCATAINDINNSEDIGSGLAEKLNQLDENKKKLVSGGILVAAVATAPVALTGGVAMAAKYGFQEYKANMRIREYQADILRCQAIVKHILKSLERKAQDEYPNKEPFDEEYGRAYQTITNSFKEQEAEASSVYLKEIENIKNEDISRAIDALTAQFEQSKAELNRHYSAKIQHNGEIVATKIRELYGLLHTYTDSQDGVTIDELNKKEVKDLVKSADELILAGKMRSLDKKLLLFNNLELYESLDLMLFPDEGTDIDESFAYLEYNWTIYNRILSMREEVRYIMEECGRDREFIQQYASTTRETVREYLQKQFDELYRQETELYVMRTQQMSMGDDFLTETVCSLPETIAKIMSAQSENFTPFAVRSSGKLNLQNMSLLCIYQNEEQDVLMANFVESLVYSVLHTQHTESVVVNVLNPKGKALYDGLQIDRDKVSNRPQDKGKVIKGPDYVKAFVTQTDSDDLYKRLEIADSKLTKSSRGKTFEEVVRERRSSRGIVPKFTINICVDVPLDGNYMRYLTGSDVKGVLNIVIQDKAALIAMSYESDKNRFKEAVDMSGISYARLFNSIVEITEQKVITSTNSKMAQQSVFTLSNRGYMTQHNTVYTQQPRKVHNKIRDYLKSRALANSTISPETNEFIKAVVTRPGLEARQKEKSNLEYQRSVLDNEKKSIALNPGTPLERLSPLEGDDLDYALWYQNKVEREFEERCRVNPNAFFEMSFEETLPLYWGYVDGDRGKLTPIILDEISKPHLFIGGTTGGGKSNNLACAVNVLKAGGNPEDVDVVYFDFKVAEVALHAKPYKMPQCSAMCGTYEPAYLVSLLQAVDKEMMRRYVLISKYGTSKLSSLRKLQKKERAEVKGRIDKAIYKLDRKDRYKLSSEDIQNLQDEIQQLWKAYNNIEVTPRMLFLVDEAAQGFQSEDDDVKQTIKTVFTRLAQLARAAGIHMCLLSQDVDKFPSTIIDLIANRGCTVAPPPISKNIIKNDFCARPENQFLGFMGFNCNNGNEADNVQYLVPYNDLETTTKVMSKVTDSLCNTLNLRSRDAVVFDEEEVYTYDRHNKFFEEHPDLLNGRDVYIGEGVYFQKEFIPHKFSFRKDERNSLVVMSMDSTTRNNLIEAIRESLKDHATLVPCYAKEIPDGLGPEFFNVGYGKKHGGFRAIYGKEVVDTVTLTQECMNCVGDQMFPGDVWGAWEDFYAEDSITNEEGEIIPLSEGIFKMLNEESSMYGIVEWVLAYRKEQTREKVSAGGERPSFSPYYFIVFDLTKHEYVRENAWSFWKEFSALINDAAKYDINFIFVDANTSYIDKEIGGIYLASKIEALNASVDRNLKNINPLFAKVYDVRNEFTAFVKVPVDGTQLLAKQKQRQKDMLDYIARTRGTLSAEDKVRYGA